MLGTAAGITGGYLIGKNSGDKIVQDEVSTGKKEVKTPRFWNWKAAQGFLIGNITGTGLLLASALTGNPATGFIQAAIGLIPFAGLIYGGIKGKAQMETEYNHAREIETQNNMAATIVKARSAEPQQEAGVAPTHAAPQTEAAKFTQQEDTRRAAGAAQVTIPGM